MKRRETWLAKALWRQHHRTRIKRQHGGGGISGKSTGVGAHNISGRRTRLAAFGARAAGQNRGGRLRRKTFR